jgi:hypothetical protein
MKTRAWLTVIVSALAGASVWALSPLLAGHQEPWDAEGFYYVAALGVAGAVTGLVAPRPLWAHYLGALVGQAAYAAVFLPVGPLFILGAAFLLGYTLIFLVAAALAAYVRTRLGSRSGHT